MFDEDAMLNRLSQLIEPESVIVIGLGNSDRADDGAGIQIVKTLRARFSERAFLETEQGVEGIVFDCLENPSIQSVLFVDAVDFKGRPGEMRLFTIQDAGQFIPVVSTHKVPLTILMELIHNHHKNPYLIGIQPKSIELFGEVSNEVKAAVQNLGKILIFLLS
jgi:hydrogenase 3 maturation protease